MAPRLLTSILLLVGLSACGDKDGDFFTVKDGDCNDEDANAYPGNAEVCDGIDNDCDGEVDNGATDATTYFLDADGDGYGDRSERESACALPDGFSENADDCDDTSADINPAASEVCGGGDEDCDGAIDEAGAEGETDWYRDADEDGFGDANGTAEPACSDPSTVTRPYVEDNGDCDDDDPAINPGATEVCDERDTDEDCDGQADDADESVDASTLTDWFPDADSDGFGDSGAEATSTCDMPNDMDYARNAEDCNDAESVVNPGAIELCNDIDDDCDENTTEEGVVIFDDGSGVITDVTAEWGRGDRSAPVELTLDADGTYDICFGTYYVDIDIEADVTLLGVDGADETSLDGGDLNSILTLVGDGYSVAVEGLELTNGRGDNNGVLSTFPDEGGAIYCEGESTFTVIDSLLSANIGDLGGAILVHTCDVTVTDSTIEDNQGTFGGAALVWAGGSLTLDGTTIDNNECTNSGGAIYVQGEEGSVSSLTIEDSMFTDNSSLYGAGVALLGHAEATCTGTSEAAESGFHANTGSGEYGDSALTILNANNNFAASLCDFGEADSSDDNATDDVSTDVNSEEDPVPQTYSYGDNASFTCTEEGCE